MPDEGQVLRETLGFKNPGKTMKKRVVHIVKATGIHGTEKHLLTLLSGLNNRYAVFLIVLTEPGNPLPGYFEKLKEEDINSYNVVIRSDMDPVCLWNIYRLLKKINPCLVHTHLIHGDIYGTIAAKFADIKKIISTKHNDDQFRKNRFIKALNIAISKKTAGIIAISSWIRDFIIKTEEVSPEKSRTIYYGLQDLPTYSETSTVRSELGIPGDTVVVGIIARLVKQKGHKYLIDAFCRAREKNSDILLLIVGDGDLKNELLQQVKEKGLEEAVVFTGYREDTVRMLSVIDVFVHPSLWEGFGLSILEAMAKGKAVIATKLSAIPELVIDGETGILVPSEETDILSKKIFELAENRELRSCLGRKGRERWKKMFSVDKMINETEKFYDELLADT